MPPRRSARIAGNKNGAAPAAGAPAAPAAPVQAAPSDPASPAGAPPAPPAPAAAPVPVAPPAPAAPPAPPAPPEPAAQAGPVDMHAVAHEVVTTLGPVRNQIDPNTLPHAALLAIAANLMTTLRNNTNWVPKGHASLVQPDDLVAAISLLEAQLHNALNPVKKGRANKKKLLSNDLMANATMAQKKAIRNAADLAASLAEAISSTPPGQAAAPAPAPAPVPVPVPAAPAPAPALHLGAPNILPLAFQQRPPPPPAPPAAPVAQRANQQQAQAPIVNPVIRLPSWIGPNGQPAAVQPVVPAAQVAPAPPPANLATPGAAQGQPAQPAQQANAANAANAPPVQTAAVIAAYNALPADEITARETSVRFDHYLSGRQADFYQFDPVLNRPRTVNRQLPLPGRWPGLSNAVTQQRWRDCMNNREWIPMGAPRYLRLRYRDLQAVPASRIPPVRQENQAANAPVAVGQYAQLKVNQVARNLRKVWLKFRRMLHCDSDGAVALFRHRLKYGRNARHFINFAVKAKWINAAGITATYYDRAKIAHGLLANCRHIVKMHDLRRIQHQIQHQNGRHHTNPLVPNNEYNILRADPRLLFLEFMDMDNLSKYLDKLAHSNLVPPAQTLWMILHCLVDQCIALRHLDDSQPIGVLERNGNPPRNLIHMDIGPGQIYLGSEGKHRNFPILKLSGLRKFKEQPAPGSLDAFGIRDHRLEGSDAYMPEQFTDEWDWLPVGHDGYPGAGHHSLPQWTTGNYGSHSNVFQMGQVMVSLITMEKPLLPPVPVAHYIRGGRHIRRPEYQTNPLTAADEAAVLSQAVALYDFELPGRNYDEAQTRAAVFLGVPRLRRVAPESIADDTVATKLFPYDPQTGRGWIWTYAALLKVGDAQRVAIHETRGICEPQMHELVCQMMAHRPAHRPTLEHLKRVVSKNSRLANPQAAEMDIADGSRKRDNDEYTMPYAQTHLDLLYTGIRKHKHQFPDRSHIIPFDPRDGTGHVMNWDNSSESD